MADRALYTETNLTLPCPLTLRMAPHWTLRKNLELQRQLHTELKLARMHTWTRTQIHSPTSRIRQPKHIQTSSAHCQHVALELCENTSMRMTRTCLSLKEAMTSLILSEYDKNGKGRKQKSSVHAALQRIMTVTSRGRTAVILVSVASVLDESGEQWKLRRCCWSLGIGCIGVSEPTVYRLIVPFAAESGHSLSILCYAMCIKSVRQSCYRYCFATRSVISSRRQ